MTPLSILAQSSNPGLLGNPIIMIVLMIVMFYFLLIRPQKKQRQEQEARVAALKKGDRVVTIGGMHAMVHSISKDTISLKLSEGVFVPFNKASIASVEKAAKGGAKKIEEKPAEEESKEA